MDYARILIKAIPLVLVDILGTVAAFLIASWGGAGTTGFPLFLALAATLNVAIFAAGKMYTSLWEFASTREATRIALTTLVASVADAILGALVLGPALPWRVYVLAWFVLVAVCGSSRLAIRVYSGTKGWSLFGVDQKSGKPRTLVVGAGKTGALIVDRMLGNDPDMPGIPVAAVDDDPQKVGSHIRGVRVCGTCDQIPQICESSRIDQIVVSITNVSRAERDRIYSLCAQTGVRTLTLPFSRDIPIKAGSRIPLCDVQASDLLARREIQLDLAQMDYVAGKRVLVTGGGGSIGSELVRQLLPARPAQIILFDIYENTTYELFHDIVKPAHDQGTDIRMYIGSITNEVAIGECFEMYRPHVVFHAAAHKHVPLMERNAREAVDNNIFGTMNVMRLAHESGCTHFVQISTDKAVNPTNVMGATKRFCEMAMQYYAANSGTVFTAVRFGNVLGSHGSVIPLFRRQMEQGGPITITHKDITRYFMTIPEASRLVITAGALARGGEIFVLNMGEPVRIWDLAVNLITLSGLKPGRDIEIKVTGLRPGEKLYEELLMDEENLIPTENPEIRVSTAPADDLETMQEKVELLRGAMGKDNDEIKRVLAQVVPTYRAEFGN